MNIFYLSESPSEAAQSLCDVHLRKMIVETCQLLQTHDILHGKEKNGNRLEKIILAGEHWKRNRIIIG